jgi:hypothetical protein
MSADYHVSKIIKRQSQNFSLKLTKFELCNYTKLFTNNPILLIQWWWLVVICSMCRRRKSFKLIKLLFWNQEVTSYQFYILPKQKHTIKVHFIEYSFNFKQEVRGLALKWYYLCIHIQKLYKKGEGNLSCPRRIILFLR